MKKKMVVVVATIVVITGMSFNVLDDNGKAGATGSPSESTCAQSGCHNTYTVNTGGGSVTIAAPTMTGWQYVPGQTYAISVTVAKSGVNLFGLGFEALTSAGANAGTLTAGTGTALKSATIAGNSRTSIVHALNGGATANTHTFTFNWKAPATNIGNITFYCAGNAANKNGSVSGDYIYTTSQVITPASSNGIQHQAYSEQVAVFPNPASDHIQIIDYSQTSDLLNISIFDMNGALVTEKSVKPNERIAVDNLKTGIYALQITSSKGIAVRKFLKQ